MRLDIVIPAHNEEHRIGPMLDAYRAGCEGSDVRFFVALDRCTDGTAEIVARHAAEDPRISIHEHPKLGKGGVIMETFRRCDADLVGFVDADCATPPRELLRLAQVATRSDGAIASRRHPSAVLPVRRRPLRELTSAGFALGIRRLFGLPYGDTQCGAKVFRREVIERVLPLLSSRDFLFDVDVLVVARELGFEIEEVPTIWIDREGSRVRAVADARKMALSALRLWFHHRALPVEMVPSDPAAEAESGGVAATGDVSEPRARGEASRAEPRAGASAGGELIRGPWLGRARPDVVLITPYPPPGVRHGGRSGVASYAANLAHALACEGAEVKVIAPREPGEAAVAKDGPIEVRRAFDRGAGAMPRAAQAAAELGGRATHVQHELFLYGGPEAMPGLVYGLERLGRSGPRPVVTMHHVVAAEDVDADFVRLHRVRAPASFARFGLAALQAAIRRTAGRVIVHEPSFARTIGGADVVPHGLELVEPEPVAAARKALGLERNLTALCFGFIAPYKGLELALEAAAAAGGEVELVVAGGEHPRLADRDPYARELRERWGDVARFTGHVPEQQVRTWFSAADVALFMYPRPFAASGALALALAHGTASVLSPALAAATEAPPELIAPTDPARLGAELRRLAREPQRLTVLREAARDLARDRAWPAVARRHLEIYEEVSHAHGADDRLVRAS